MYALKNYSAGYAQTPQSGSGWIEYVEDHFQLLRHGMTLKINGSFYTISQVENERKRFRLDRPLDTKVDYGDRIHVLHKSVTMVSRPLTHASAHGARNVYVQYVQINGEDYLNVFQMVRDDEAGGTRVQVDLLSAPQVGG